MTKGKLIVIDSGSDASGKETQVNRLFNRLTEEGYKVRKITFPNYSSPACEPVKMYLSGEFGGTAKSVNAHTASMFFSIDRFASFKKEWEDFYNSGGIVLTDRYTSSNMIHQGIKLPSEELNEYLDWLTDLEYNKMGLPVPTKVIFLDVPPVISLQLMANRANKITGEEEKDIHEKDTVYLKECYDGAQSLVEKLNWTKVDCSKGNKLRTIEDISEEIFTIVVKTIE